MFTVLKLTIQIADMLLFLTVIITAVIRGEPFGNPYAVNNVNK